MSPKFTSLLAACAMTAAVFAATSPAVAKQRPIVVTAPAEDIPIRYVSYRDLNLTTSKDEAVLVRRVRFAVNDVCDESVGYDTAFRTNLMSCRNQSWGGAKPQIDRAVARARDIASNGWSAIAPVAISISVR